ncbi:hypothetical protein MUP79_07790 [Candidatus Bathyarchaeota archaeon]|nr:hypothetical protein [Candidatus Bathyarchaeota archaeon]
MVNGFWGKILRVDLTNGSFKEEPLPYDEATLRKFIGGLGIAMKMLYDEVPPGVRWQDPDNRIILNTGVLTGLAFPCATNSSLCTINRDVPTLPGISHSCGLLGNEIRKTGYDAVIIQGAAEKPVYLYVTDGNAEIKDASQMWGTLDSFDTEDAVRKDLNNPKARCMSIGPAGENYAMTAAIVVDKYYGFWKEGAGAVMGSKKLKSIAFYGKRNTFDVGITDKEKLREVSREYSKAMYTPSAFGHTMELRAGRGTKEEIEEMHKRETIYGSQCKLAARNWSNPYFPQFQQYLELAKKRPSYATREPVHVSHCWGCPWGEEFNVVINFGGREFLARKGPGGEPVEGAAAMVGVGDVDGVFYLIDLVNRLGMDAGTAGSVAGLLMELYERGIITIHDTEGLDLRFGNAEAAAEIYRRIAYRKPFGKWGAFLSDGPKHVAETIGGDAMKYCVHVKGTTPNMHDWRGLWGTFLAQLIGGRGPAWEAAGSDFYAYEPDLGYNGFREGTTSIGTAEAVKKHQAKKIWGADCTGLCWKGGSWGVPGSSRLCAEAIAALTGWKDFTTEEGMIVGERIVNLQKIFATRRGQRGVEDDLDIGPRVLEAPPTGPARGKPVGPYVKGMIEEYYDLMGWDRKTGRPYASTLKRLSMEDYIKDTWG